MRCVLGVKDPPISPPFVLGSARAGYEDVGGDDTVLGVYSLRAEDAGYTGDDSTKRGVSRQARDMNGTEDLTNTCSVSCKTSGTRCVDT